MADEVDPRFDPRYQRGFDPAVHPVTTDSRRSSLSRSAPERSTITTPSFAEQTHIDPPEPGGVEVRPRHEDESENENEVDDEVENDFEPRRLNPFRLALLIISLGCLAASAALLMVLTGVYSQGYSGTSAESIFAYTIASSASGPLLSAGIIGVVLWIAVGAVLPRRATGE